jgi:hypothetical protein
VAEVVEELVFPMEFPKCVCGYEGPGLVALVGAEERKKGRLISKATFAAWLIQVAVADPVFTPISAPVLKALVEICPECGTLRAFNVERAETKIGNLGFNPQSKHG